MAEDFSPLTPEEIAQLLKRVDPDNLGNNAKDDAGFFILTPEEREELLKVINDDKTDTHPVDTRERVTMQIPASTESNGHVSLTTNQLTIKEYVPVIDKAGALEALQKLKDLILKKSR